MKMLRDFLCPKRVEIDQAKIENDAKFDRVFERLDTNIDETKKVSSKLDSVIDRLTNSPLPVTGATRKRDA